MIEFILWLLQVVALALLLLGSAAALVLFAVLGLLKLLGVRK